jgi:hypothetical protein
MSISRVEWKTPWRPLDPGTEMPSVQKQLEREITSEHPLHGKKVIAIARRCDSDDVLVRVGDGTYANVHLVWGDPGSAGDPAMHPTFSVHGSLEAFVSAMQKDFDEYGEQS